MSVVFPSPPGMIPASGNSSSVQTYHGETPVLTCFICDFSLEMTWLGADVDAFRHLTKLLILQTVQGAFPTLSSPHFSLKICSRQGFSPNPSSLN